MSFLNIDRHWYSYIFDVTEKQVNPKSQSLEEGVNNLLTLFNPSTNSLCLLLDYEEKSAYFEYNFGLNPRRNYFYEYGPSSYFSLRLYIKERSSDLVITNNQLIHRALIGINSIKRKEGFQLMQELRVFFEHSEVLEEGKLDYICLPLGFGYDPRKKTITED